ncbi:MAG: tetratricopeptide repeat protein, partial [Planctomycetota bacterium]
RTDAVAVYDEALTLLHEQDPRYVTLLLRRAMLSMQDASEAKDALAEFAASDACDPEMRNRAAVVLALLGRPQDAIDLFVVSGEGSKLFRQEIRMAEWAVKADDAEAAQEWAWKARTTAVLRRDRYYALTVLSEAHRLDDSLDALLESFANAEQLDPQSHEAWIGLLRETGKYDVAVALFEEDADANGFDDASRRELLEMYREAGRSEEMVAQYRLLMQAEPRNTLWPEGLSRFYLEQGETEAARELWDYFLHDAEPGLVLVAAAEALMGLGQDDLATACAERCIEAEAGHFAALQFLFDMHRLRGELEEAAAVLERTDTLAPLDSPARMQLAESFERIGDQQRAVDVLEQLRSAREGLALSEDLEMRLAWLHSEVGNEDLALERWRELWRRVDSIPRRRYVEDRLMSVASRLGKLADIAIELEGRLYAGTADERDSGLLVRLYTKVGDPVSATEIIEEFLKQSGGSAVVALEEKARVFMSCNDYHNYERTVRQLIEVHPEGEADYLQQIAMSMLERGKPDEVRVVLKRLETLESQATSAEFEAGVLALSGMEPEAIQAYRRGLANNPDRIESYLMMASLMEKVGDKAMALGMFQDLALNADKDDLFIIAIDGLLNLDAQGGVLEWARRLTLERLARRHDKVYLYQLLADLGEQADDNESRIIALQQSLAIAGDRRVSVVRELMDLVAGRNNSVIFIGGQPRPAKGDRQLHFGRRLIGLGQMVPPQVYLDLGRTFLARGAVSDASKTFRLARDLPDYDHFQKDVAGLFEQNGYLDLAAETYRRVLIGDSTNVGLLVKVGELQEQLSDDAGAAGFYRRAVELLLSRRPLMVGDQEGESTEKYSRWAARNVDDFDKYFERASNGFLVTYPAAAIPSYLEQQALTLSEEVERASTEQDRLEEPLPWNRFPRLFRRSQYLRRLALSYGELQLAEEMDRRLLDAFPEDDKMLEVMVKERIRWGLNNAAHELLLASGRPTEEVDGLLWLIGKGEAAAATELVAIDEALRLLLPMLTTGKLEDARLLLRRVDFAGVDAKRGNDVGALYSAAAMIGDPELSLYLGRNWVRLLLNGERVPNYYTLGPILQRISASLTEELRLSFYQYFVQLVLEDSDKYGELLVLLPQIQKEVSTPLIESEELVALVTDKAQSFVYTLGPLLLMAPEEERVGIASAVYTKVAPTMRTYFLFGLMDVEVGPLGASMEEQILDWLRETNGEDDSMPMSYLLGEITSDEAMETNGSLIRGVIGVLMELNPESLDARYGNLRLLVFDKKEEEAMPLAVELYYHPKVQDEENWDAMMIREFIKSDLLPKAPERFLAYFDAEIDTGAPSLERAEQRLDLIRSLKNDDLYLEALQQACADLPDEMRLQKQLIHFLNGQRQYAEADALLASLIEDEPEDLELANLRLSLWSGRENSVQVWDALQQVLALEEEEAAEVEVEEESAEKLPRPTFPLVKEAMKEENLDAATTLLRRMWRTFPVGNNSRRIYFSRNARWTQGMWPLDEDAEEATEEELAEQKANMKRLMRGGLDAYREPLSREEQEAQGEDTGPERKLAWEVLAAEDFGAAEIQRFLRQNGPQSLGHYTTLFDALAGAYGVRFGEEQAVSDLIAKVEAGDALKYEILLLLSLLERYPETMGPHVQGVLDEFTDSLHPRDASQLLRLASVMAATGARERAVDLYRWCSTLTSSGSRYYFEDEEDFASIDVGQLVREMRKNLESGEDLIAIVEQALAMSKPGDNPWELADYQRLTLNTWIALLEPAEALEKCRDICAAADKDDINRWSSFSHMAAWLYAHEGEYERAVACLEAYFEPSQGFGRWRPTLQSSGMLKRLFPEDASAWKDANAWLRLIGPILLEWGQEDLLVQTDALKAVALAVVRLHQHGDVEGAQLLFVALDDQDFVSQEASLWIADAARRIGLTERADTIEEELFDLGKLNPVRTVEALERRVAAGEIDSVLAYGEDLVAYRQPQEILELMHKVASDAGKTELATTWSERLESAKAAQEKLDAYWEEKRANNPISHEAFFFH